MTFDVKRNKGIHDRSFKPIKISINKTSTYETVLKACTEVVWQDWCDDISETDFYLADASGVSLGDKELKIYGNDTTITVPWTIDNYLKVVHKFPSTARLYSVKTGTIICTFTILCIQVNFFS